MSIVTLFCKVDCVSLLETKLSVNLSELQGNGDLPVIF